MENITIAGMTSQAFKEFSTHKEGIKTLVDAQKSTKLIINQQLLNFQNDNSLLSIKGRQYLRWILKQSNNGFYVLLPNDSRIGLIKKNLKVFYVIGLLHPNVAIKEFFDNELCLEIDSIVSLKKGEGYKVMSKILEFARRISLPVSLLTETEENVEYFKRYGFENYGRLGDNNEFLMILKPSN